MNAISQSATNLAVSPLGEQKFDIEACVKRNAERTAKGTTRERQFLQRNKLISSCCADYRAHFPMIYGKTERLPSAVYNEIEKAVDTFITAQMARIHNLNVISMRRSFFHNSRDMEITERITNVGENKLSLQEQLLGVTTFITQAERRLKDLEAKPTPDYDREKAVKANIMRLQLTKDFILGEMATQDKAKQGLTEEGRSTFFDSEDKK